MINDAFVDAIAYLQSRGSQPELVEIAPPDLDTEVAGRLFHLAVPSGVTTHDVTAALLKTLPTPQRREGMVDIASLDSFIDFARRMKEPSTVLFANPTKSTITAVFDYHDAVNPGWNVVIPPLDPTAPASEYAAGVSSVSDHSPLPRWGRFSARYAFPLHRSWKTWKGKDKEAMSQADLANFIEDNIIDVHDTKGGADIQSDTTKLLIEELGLKLAGRAKLLTAARGLSIQVTEKIGSIVNTQNGETTINYEQTHTDGSAAAPGTVSKLDVPSAFIILLPVYNGSNAFEMMVRLRYRKGQGALAWWYDIYNVDRAMELAFEDACKKIVYETSLPLFYANT